MHEFYGVKKVRKNNVYKLTNITLVGKLLIICETILAVYYRVQLENYYS